MMQLGTRRRLLVAVGLAIVSLLAVGAARTRASSTDTTASCVATYNFDDLQILQDSDDRTVFPGPDRWTIHTYVYVKTLSGGTKIGNGSERNFGVLKGVAGDTIPVGWADLDHVVVGNAGEDVTVWMPARAKANRVKEVDRSSVGTTDKTTNPYGIDAVTIPACTPGVYHLSAQDDLPEADGADVVVQLDFTLTLENS
jgi:hypothetical protein